MKHILVLFASTEGQTAKIAHHLAERLTSLGAHVHEQDVSELSEYVSLDDYDGVIVGGSIHAGEIQKPLRTYARRFHHHLAALPSAFFMVCLAAASKRPDAPDDVRRMMQEFFEDTQWHPKLAVAFAGALKYSEYGFIKKRIMRAIAKREGGDTDMSHDYEYTRWASVDHFADDFLRSISRAA